jgi:hypothetical protein
MTAVQEDNSKKRLRWRGAGPGGRPNPTRRTCRAAFHLWPGSGLSLGARGRKRSSPGAHKVASSGLVAPRANESWPWVPQGQNEVSPGSTVPGRNVPRLHSAGPKCPQAPRCRAGGDGPALEGDWRRSAGKGEDPGSLRLLRHPRASKVIRDLVARGLPENNSKPLETQGRGPRQKALHDHAVMCI